MQLPEINFKKLYTFMCNSVYSSIIHYLNQRKFNSQPNIYIQNFHNHTAQMNGTN